MSGNFRKSRIIQELFSREKLNDVFGILATVFILQILIRVFEYFLLYSKYEMDHMASFELQGVLCDISTVSVFSIVWIIVYVSLAAVSKKVGLAISIILVVIFFLLEISLILYLGESLTALSYGNLMGMDDQQALSIITIYGYGWTHIMYAVLVVIMIVVFILIVKKVGKRKWASCSASLLFVFGCFNFFVFPTKAHQFDSPLNYHLTSNKVDYFFESYFDYLENERQIKNANIENEINNYYQLNGIQDKRFEAYPFLDLSKNPNYLGEYFEQKDTAPNIVFIVCESLGRVFSGSDSRLGSFTPFLDSLANHSLYWENCLSNAERTFGALPNLLAGLPEGDLGFLNLKPSYPKHLSLPLLLHDANGYQTSFFCGAWKDFDNMNDYLMFQKFDNIYGYREFRSLKSGAKNYEEGDKFTWGVEDLDVFNQSMEMFDSEISPFFNLYLTTSFHEPFSYKNQEVFIQMAKEKLEELGLGDRQAYLRNIETFAALMYMDNSIRTCINQYRKRSDFDNTIFVVVGDHSLKFMTNEARIEKYHVPLLIYSPLLEKTGRFKNVVCHKDVPSAIQSLLKNNFDLKMPDFSISTSSNLKTKNEFESTGSFPLMYADKELDNFLYHDFFLSDGRLYRLEENLKLNYVDTDSEQLNKLIRRRDNYKVLNHYVCYEHKICPDSIYNQYTSNSFYLERKVTFEPNDPATSSYEEKHITHNNYYSGGSALFNNGGLYLTLLKPFKLKLSGRIRVKFSFYYKMERNESATVYVNVETKNGESKQKFILQSEELKESQAEGWRYFEKTAWFPTAENTFGELRLFTHLPSHNDLWIDDFHVEVEHF